MVTVAVLGSQVNASFAQILGAPGWAVEDLDRDEVEEQRQRYDLWALNAGLHRLGHASADYKLRDCPEQYEVTQSLLRNLADDLRICKSNMGPCGVNLTSMSRRHSLEPFAVALNNRG